MILDELTIMIEADARGIESTLKKTLGIVSGTIGQMNKQEVDWTSIFTRAISPAIISGVASVFALAISQSLAFQQSMNTTGTAAGESAGQIAQTGQAALNMSANLGQSAGNIANTMLQVSSIFGANTQDTKDVTQAMSELADSGFGSLNDITQSTIVLFKEFGVTTRSQAIDMLTSLMHAAQGAKESIPAIAQQFGQFAPALVAAGASVKSFNGLIASFGGIIESAGLPAANAQFTALASSANNVVGPMELLGVSSLPGIKSAIQNGDLVGLLDKTATKLHDMGSNAYLVATAFGFSKDQIDQFNIRAKNFPQVDKDTKAIAVSTQSIADAWNQSDNAIREFTKLWNNLASIMTSGPISEFLTLFAKGLNDDLNIMKSMASIEFQGLKKDATDLVALTTGQAGSNLYDLTHPPVPTQPTISTLDQINSKLSGIGISNKNISNIDTVAKNGNSLDYLLSALTGGISTPNSSQYNNIKTSFNLTLPNAPVSAKDLANLLYAKFQGTLP